MRVLFVANTMPPADLSGVGEQVLQLATGLRERGHEVEILGRGGLGARGSKLFFPMRIVGPALRRVAAFAPDVVQVHESDGAFLAAAIRRRQLRPRLVALLQVSYVEERRSVRPLMWKGEILGRPGAVERRFRRFKAPIQIALGRRSARAADLVLAPSAATARELERDYGARRVAVVPNASGGWPLIPEPIAELAGATEQPYLYVGRLRIRKGVEVFLAALARLRSTGRRPEVWVVGEGEHRDALGDTAGRMGVSDQVRFLGRRSSSEIRWALERCRALVVPSIYEGMPLVILEAMAAARPVIASQVSGIPEVVRSGETGWLVKPEDPPALGAALGEAFDTPAEELRRGAAGRRRFHDHYRPGPVAECWEKSVAAVFAAESGV